MQLDNQTNIDIIKSCASTYIFLSNLLHENCNLGITKEDDQDISQSLNLLQAVIESNDYAIGDDLETPLQLNEEREILRQEAYAAGYSVHIDHDQENYFYFCGKDAVCSDISFPSELEAWENTIISFINQSEDRENV